MNGSALMSHERHLRIPGEHRLQLPPLWYGSTATVVSPLPNSWDQVMNKYNKTQNTDTVQANPATERPEKHTETIDNSNIPDADVLQEDISATTKPGRPRQRMIWNNEMNEHIMRCYFTATNLETIKPGYRPAMRTMFLKKYPQLDHISKKRIMDQKRVIIVNNRIPANNTKKRK